MDPIRLDRLLVDRGLVASRPRAERLITDHGVLVDGLEVRKAGKKVRPDATLDLLGEDLSWVSRGALKLVAALDHFQLDPTGRVVLDLGASTGGFTEICLARGARFVHAVDVGTDQLVPALRDNDRVADLQQTHLKDLRVDQLDPLPDTVVIDLSFISLDHVWVSPPPLAHACRVGRGPDQAPPEVGPKHLGRNGIVRHPAIRRKALRGRHGPGHGRRFHL